MNSSSHSSLDLHALGSQTERLEFLSVKIEQPVQCERSIALTLAEFGVLYSTCMRHNTLRLAFPSSVRIKIDELANMYEKIKTKTKGQGTFHGS